MRIAVGYLRRVGGIERRRAVIQEGPREEVSVQGGIISDHSGIAGMGR